MKDRSKCIFGNVMPDAVYNNACKSKENYIKKYGDDSKKDYPLALEDNRQLGDILGIKNVRIAESMVDASTGFDEEKGIVVGNIRMGFGHYRISMAIASAAHYMGYTPYWLDLNSFPETTCTKVISAQNDMYSMGSRISGKSKVFNKLIWEPVNYDVFKQLAYNASDQKNAELMAPVYKNIPKNIPVVATHVWPSQAAVHAGMKYVVNAIPDNWPMALHLSEGALHIVQTHQAYQGYRTLNGMALNQVLREIPRDQIKYVGHYIDHELVANIEEDCERRIRRADNKEPIRFLLTIGGAGAQKEIFAAILNYLMPHVKKGRCVVMVNVGDYKNVWDELRNEIDGLKKVSVEHFDDWQDTKDFADRALDKEIRGVHGFYHSDIFEAVYCTNLLMRCCDVLVTKPSELAFYPVPKLFIKRVGGHERWGAIHSAEIGDGTMEQRDIPHTLQMLRLFLKDKGLLKDMCENIVQNKKAGIYDGAYKAVELAMEMKKNNC